MPNTYLTVPFKEKDSAKALGARWDGEVRRWYVPQGHDLAPFAQWLPTEAAAASNSRELMPPASCTTALQVPSRGISLSRLLAGVAKAVSDAFATGVWTTAEVLRASARDGHVYLELSERDAEGRVVAKAQAAIWARTAQRIVPEFERATGATLGEGIKLLVRAKPVFKPQYGFSLEIDAIDPTYTLGDLEARKREIRERLQREQLFDLNKRLPAPWDFCAVLVVAPQNAAGLGDFAKEADRLNRLGICEFHYVHSRFQGEGAAGEIREALQAGLGRFRNLPDALIIIRGGGAVNDLAWLNDYELARFICECPVPVLTGIGHERDSTVLDEVAHRRFDTPSKVIAGIEQQVLRRAREAQAHFDAIVQRAASDTDRTRARVDMLEREVKTCAAATLAEAQAQCSQRLADLRLEAVRTVHRATGQAEKLFGAVRSNAMQSLAEARQTVPATMEAIRAGAFAALRTMRFQLGSTLPALLDRTRLDIRRAAMAADSIWDGVIDRAWQTLRNASTSAEALFREIAGQGPQKTLGRGFAMVRRADGKTLSAADGLAAGQVIEVTFRDGMVDAAVQHVRLRATNNVEDRGNDHGRKDVP